MAYSLINNLEAALGVNGGTSGSIDTTGASFLVLAVSYYPGGSAPTISDSKSNTWTPLTLTGTAFTGCRIYYSASATTGSGHTFTASGSGAYVAVCVLAFSGSHATPFDAENGNSGTASTISTGSVTPSEGNEVVIAALSHENNSGAAVSINGGFTAYTQAHAAGNNQGCGIAYLIQTTATAANPTWDITNSAQLSARIACFKAAAAAAGNRRRRVLFCGRAA